MPPLGPKTPAALHTSNCLAPFFNCTTCMLSESVAYNVPLGATAMSLQLPPGVGNGYLPLVFPLFRSNAKMVDGGPPAPVAGASNGCLEHTLNVWAASSA